MESEMHIDHLEEMKETIAKMPISAAQMMKNHEDERGTGKLFTPSHN